MNEPEQFAELEQRHGAAIDRLLTIERAWLFAEARRKFPLARAGQAQRLAALRIYAAQLREVTEGTA